MIDGMFYGYYCEEGKVYADCIKSGEYMDCWLREEMGRCLSEESGKPVKTFKKGQVVNESWAFPKKVIVCDDPEKYGTKEFLDAFLEYVDQKEKNRDSGHGRGRR